MDPYRENSLNVFSSEITGSVKAKFHMEPQWVGRMKKVCSLHLGHLTKMAAKSIHSKNPLKICFSGTKWPMALGLGMQQWGHVPNKVRKIIPLC